MQSLRSGNFRNRSDKASNLGPRSGLQLGNWFSGEGRIVWSGRALQAVFIAHTIEPIGRNIDSSRTLRWFGENESARAWFSSVQKAIKSPPCVNRRGADRCLAIPSLTILCRAQAEDKALPWRSCLMSAVLAETLDQSTIMLDLVGDDQLAVL